MKKHLLLIISIVCCIFTACENNGPELAKTVDVTVVLSYPEDGDITATEGVEIKLTNTMGAVYTSLTDAAGAAVFNIPIGIYEASASEVRASDGYSYIFNGVRSGITVSESWNSADAVTLQLTVSRAGQVIIKELYTAGCRQDENPEKAFMMDQYVILYNNSAQTATIENLCIGRPDPANAHGTNNNYINGELAYASLGFIPAHCGIWYMTKPLTIEPYGQAVIALNGAVNHTLTYSKSVDLSNADYVCYDLDDFSHTKYYPAPSENIPTGNYLSAYKYGMGTGWALSTTGAPAIFIFSTQEKSPEEFASAADYYYPAGKEGQAVYCCAKVPTDWILDGVEVFSTYDLDNSKKRLTPAIDGGNALLTKAEGYTNYRNVDKEATEALPENEGKLVYGYDMGTDDSTDPSGIDAEASLKNGAHIIYMDTNNSANDFHQRKKASIKN